MMDKIKDKNRNKDQNQDKDKIIKISINHKQMKITNNMAIEQPHAKCNNNSIYKPQIKQTQTA